MIKKTAVMGMQGFAVKNCRIAYGYRIKQYTLQGKSKN
jgi:hypothetical protein